MHFLTRHLIALLLLALFWSLPSSPAIARPANDGPVILMLLPYTDFDAWYGPNAPPTLQHLEETGALALMNTRSAYTPGAKNHESAEAAALTIGCGARAADSGAAAESTRGEAMQWDGIRAADLFTRRTGTIPQAGAEVLLRWPEVIRENIGRGYDVHPGNLGDALRAAKVKVRAGGGTLSTPVAVSGDGTVFRISEAALDTADRSTFLVWDAGPDLPACEDTLRRAAETVSRTGGTLIVASLARREDGNDNAARLTPLVFWGPAIRPGLIWSPSTHRAGIVTNTDLAPTIAARFGANLPVAAFGKPLVFQPEPGAFGRLKQLERVASDQLRAMSVLPAVAVSMGLFILVGVFLARRAALPAWVPALPPLAVLCVLMSASPTRLMNFGIAGALLLLTLAVRPPRRNINVGLSAATAGILLLDLCTGGNLMRHSVLGYSPYEGARYFGLGNEAMGVLVGALLVFAGSRLDAAGLRGRITLYGLLLGTTLLLGAPFAGAKAGGVLVAGAAFGTLAAVRESSKSGARIILMSLLAAAALLGLFAGLDALRPAASQSHMGGSVHRIMAGGWSEAVDIVARKARVELRLLVHSTWAVPLWASVCGMILSARRRMGALSRGDRALLWASAAAIGACLLFNDAGVVAAALCGVQLWGGMYAKKPASPPVDGARAVFSEPRLTPP